MYCWELLWLYASWPGGWRVSMRGDMSEMFEWCHYIMLGGWQPPQTAPPIYIRQIQSVLTHWYLVHWHTVSALHSYTHTTWLRFGGSGPLEELKWCHDIMVGGWQPPHTASCIHIRHLQSVWAHRYSVHWHRVSALHRSCNQSIWLIFGGSGSYGLEMMSLHHGWGWQPPQTASPSIHIRLIKSVWAH